MHIYYRHGHEYVLFDNRAFQEFMCVTASDMCRASEFSNFFFSFYSDSTAILDGDGRFVPSQLTLSSGFYFLASLPCDTSYFIILYNCFTFTHSFTPPNIAMNK